MRAARVTQLLITAAETPTLGGASFGSVAQASNPTLPGVDFPVAKKPDGSLITGVALEEFVDGCDA